MTEPGQVEEKMRIKEQPGNENGNDNDTTQPSRSSLCKRIILSVAAEEFQRPPGVRIQQKKAWFERFNPFPSKGVSP